MPFAVLLANLPAGIIGRIRQKTRICAAWLKDLFIAACLKTGSPVFFLTLGKRKQEAGAEYLQYI